MYNFLKNMGFIDITDKPPIKFHETVIGADESNPGFFENHLDNTEPEWWTYIPKFQLPDFN